MSERSFEQHVRDLAIDLNDFIFCPVCHKDTCDPPHHETWCSLAAILKHLNIPVSP